MGFLDQQLAALQSDLQYIKNDVLGLKSAISGKSTPGSVPWNSKAYSKYFQAIDIKTDRWDQLFPYRLLVIDARTNSVVGSGGASASIETKAKGSATINIINFEAMDSKWIYRLPISPQQLSITDQFAINTSATLRGVLEEHGGVKFKMINAAGTFGVWPYRQSVTAPPSSPGIIRSVFGGTLEGLGNVISQVTGTINAATSNHPASKPVTVRPDMANPTSTGYYHALAMQQFLEQYAEAKKDPDNSHWRLVFDIPKQGQSLVVTPQQFSWEQSAAKPLEIMFRLQMKAWRRVNIGTPPAAPKIEAPISPGILQKALATVTSARRTLSSVFDLIGAVRSDARVPLEILRQTSLFIKDLSGVSLAASELPSQIATDYSSAIGDFVKTVDLNSLSPEVASDTKIFNAFSQLKASFSSREGLSLDAVASGQLGKQAQMAQSIDPAHNVLSDPDRNFSLFNEVPLDSLRLNNIQQAKVDEIVENARQTTVDDLKQYRAVILELSLQLSNNFGAGDSYFSQVYSKPDPYSRIQSMTLDEYEILQALYEVVQVYDTFTATTEVDDMKRQSNMDYVAGLAKESDILFGVPTSKIMVPVPFGLTVEAIALRYLGDAQRWLEIVTLNNLRDPYIDENGFQYKLLSNASGRQITVDSQTNLYIGQRIVLRSSTQRESARRILGIDRLSDTSFLLTLDGPADLDNFTTADGAYLQAYLPGTVNSQQKIFIPSDLPISTDPNITPPASTQGDPLTALSKVDWLQTESGDVATNSFGDFRLSAGITNLIQSLKTKFGTGKGKVVLHPNFGVGIEPGMMTSDVEVKQIFEDFNDLIKEDQRYQGITSMQIEVDGPKMVISLSVQLAGNLGVFPVTFELAA